MSRQKASLFDKAGKITGVVARDLLTDEAFEIKASPSYQHNWTLERQGTQSVK